MRGKSLIIGSLWLSGCASSWKAADQDGDGLTVADGDCWDGPEDPIPPAGAMDYGVRAIDISPNAEEDLPYDGIDQNCDGKDDFDADGDGYVPTRYAGFVTLGNESSGQLPAGDCWDRLTAVTFEDGVVESAVQARNIHPGVSIDLAYDGIDQNCDGQDDFDVDGDGYIPAAYIALYTRDESGVIAGSGSLPGGDCWDEAGEILVQAGAESQGVYGKDVFIDAAMDMPYDGIDQNCDGENDFDADGDGYVPDIYIGLDTRIQTAVVNSAVRGGDCWDDPEADITAIQMDAINDFSQLEAIEVFPEATDRPYDGIDQNCDGESDFDADNDGFPTTAYSDREGVLGTDCNDDDAAINPNAQEEVGDGIDQNCDGEEGCYLDADGDGFGSNTPIAGSPGCGQAQEANFPDDCDDSSAQTYPGAAENDSMTDCMKDTDADGYGDLSPPNGVIAGSDCDDSSDVVYPLAMELTASGQDENCDGLEVCFIDQDGDGFGSFSEQTSTDWTCATAGLSTFDNDCDDADIYTYVGIASLDSTSECMRDADGDGYGDDDQTGAFVAGQDCNDNDPLISPAATEIVIDGVDQDCDGYEDCYEDADNDGFGVVTIALSVDLACNDAFVSSNTEDCDDTSATTYPGAASLDSSIDCMKDDDGDLSGDANPPNGVIAGTDCDDSENKITPFAVENCNDALVNNDCVDETVCLASDLSVNDIAVYGDDSFGGSLSVGALNGGAWVAVGTPLVNAYQGEVALFSDFTSASTVADADIVIVPDPATTGSFTFGIDVSLGSDLNNDGAQDVAISAQAGARGVYLFWGPLGQSSYLSSDADLYVDTTSLGSSSAYHIAVSDVSGDGVADLLVSAQEGSSDRGRVEILLGGSSLNNSTTLTLPNDSLSLRGPTQSELGRSLEVADLNGDGLDDLVAGAPCHLVNKGTTFIVLSPIVPAGINMVNNGMAIRGEYSGDFFGQDIALGDIDADGYAEIFVLATQAGLAQNPGKLYYFDPDIYAGGANFDTVYATNSTINISGNAVATISGEYDHDMAIASLAVLEGDSPALVVGAYSTISGGGSEATENSGGQVAVYEPSALQGSVLFDDVDAAAFFWGEDGSSPGLDSRTGCAVASAGDMDVDGAEELLIGSCKWQGNSPYSGAVHLFYGPF